MTKLEQVLGANVAICDASDCSEPEEVGVLIFAELPEGMTRREWLMLVRAYLVTGVLSMREPATATNTNYSESENIKIIKDYDLPIIEVEFVDDTQEVIIPEGLPKWTC